MMGSSSSSSSVSLMSPSVKQDKFGGPSAQKIVIVGYAGCYYFETSKSSARKMGETKPNWAEFEVYACESKSLFKQWLASPPDAAEGRPTTSEAQSHTTSPFIYYKGGGFIGGNDKFQELLKSSNGSGL